MKCKMKNKSVDHTRTLLEKGVAFADAFEWESWNTFLLLSTSPS